MTLFFAAAHGMIVNEGRFLVTKRTTGKNYMPGKWDIPGGGIEAGESPEQALLREISEETGITADIGRIIMVYNNMSQFPVRQTFQIVFACTVVSGAVALSPREHEAFRWVTVEEASSLDLINFLQAALPLIQS